MLSSSQLYHEVVRLKTPGLHDTFDFCIQCYSGVFLQGLCAA